MTFVQNADRNVGPAAFKHLEPGHLLVTSIFYTVQGEGPYAGRPAIFIRMAGCNRGAKVHSGCEFCDTAFQLDRGTIMSFPHITEIMSHEIASKRKAGGDVMAVITGGEPMIQKNVSEFARYLVDVGLTLIQFESNGDMLAKNFPDGKVYREKVKLIVSPKMAGGKYQDISNDVLDRLDVLKFVISGDPDDPYHNLPDWIKSPYDTDDFQIYLSPLTVYNYATPKGLPPSMWDNGLINIPATRINYRRAAALALEHGFRLSMQQHLFYELD